MKKSVNPVYYRWKKASKADRKAVGVMLTKARKKVASRRKKLSPDPFVRT